MRFNKYLLIASTILLILSTFFLYLPLASSLTTISDTGINVTNGGNVSANYLSQFFEWSGLRNIPNIIYSIWTTQNDNSLLVSNGTAIGYNSTIFNNSVIGIVNTMATNLTVNNSDFLDGFNSSYFYPYSNPLNLTNNTQNDLRYAPISIVGDNSSWNQSLADTLYASIIWGYNQTTATYNLYNALWSSTYNETYAGLINNASYLSTYNSTYDTHVNNFTAHNSTFWYNHTLAVNTLWGQWFYNMTQPFTDWLSTFIYNYNQTTPAINDINSRFWNRTQTWNITQIYNTSEIDSFNASWSSTYNSTYDAKAGAGNFNCTSSNVLQNVTTSTSGITGQCVALPSGDGGWLPNNATENNNYTTTGNITVNYGFFSYVGSLVSRITKGWFTDLDATNINATNINATNYRDRNNVLLGGTIFTQNNTVNVDSSGLFQVTGSLFGTGKGNLTLPANFCSSGDSGKTIRVSINGIFTTGGTAPTATFTSYLNQTTIMSTAAITSTKALTNQGWNVVYIITCQTIGTSGKVWGQGLVNIAISTTDSQLVFMPAGSSVTVDTTVPQTIDFKITWGIVGGSSIISTNAVVESLN